MKHDLNKKYETLSSTDDVHDPSFDLLNIA